VFLCSKRAYDGNGSSVTGQLTNIEWTLVILSVGNDLGAMVCARILALLEDDATARQVIESMLLSGHSVVVSKSFREAIEMLKNTPVDLILSDVHLQNGGGVFDFLKWVKKFPSTRDTPFVLFNVQPSKLAKYLEDGVRTTGRLMGAARYIALENFDADEFRQQIGSVLADDKQSKPDARKETVNYERNYFNYDGT
jgi:CheY-like chemotaxis protein